MTPTKSFDQLLKEKVDKSKRNDRKHSNQKFYMLFLAYKIMKKILLNPSLTERELKLVNSNFSRILLSILEKEKLIELKYRGHNQQKNIYNLTIEGIVYVDFIDSFLKILGYRSYDNKELTKSDDDFY